MAQKLTARSVETARPGAGRREIPDPHLQGLYLIVQPSGAKSWAVRYRHAGITRKHTLGSYPALDLKAARELASTAMRAVAEGRDPAQEKRERVAPNTVAALVADFFVKHVERHNKKRTQEETKRLYKLHVLPRWKNRLASSITRRDVIDLLEAVVDKGSPIAANRTKTAIGKLFSWAVERDILSASPVIGVKDPTPETSRERVLSDDELRAVWLAADALGEPFGTLVKLLILTGQRRSEIAEMRWSETDIDVTAPFGQPSTWIIPKERTKNGLMHPVPLSRASLKVLDDLTRRSDLVLTTNGKTPASDFSKKKRALDALLPADMPTWTLHDLRRTMASGMAKLRINLPAIEKVLNHVSGSFDGIVGVYQRHDFANEKRAALEAWGRHIDGLVTGKSANVTSLKFASRRHTPAKSET